MVINTSKPASSDQSSKSPLDKASHLNPLASSTSWSERRRRSCLGVPLSNRMRIGNHKVGAEFVRREL